MNVENQTVEQQEKIGMTDGDDRNELQPTCMRAFEVDDKAKRELAVDEIYDSIICEVIRLKDGEFIDDSECADDIAFKIANMVVDKTGYRK